MPRKVEICISHITSDEVQYTFYCSHTKKRKVILHDNLSDLLCYYKILDAEQDYFLSNRYSYLDVFYLRVNLTEEEYSDLYYGVYDYNEEERSKDINNIFTSLNSIRSMITSVKDVYLEYLKDFEDTLIGECESCENLHKNNYCKIFNIISPNKKNCRFYK